MFTRSIWRRKETTFLTPLPHIISNVCDEIIKIDEIIYIEYLT